MKKLRFPNNLKDFKNMFFTPKLTIFCIFLTFVHVCSRKMVIIIHKMWMAIWWNMANAKRKYAVTQLCQKWVFCPKTEMCEKPLKSCILICFGHHMVNIKKFIQYTDFQRHRDRVSLKKYAFYKIWIFRNIFLSLKSSRN